MRISLIIVLLAAVLVINIKIYSNLVDAQNQVNDDIEIIYEQEYLI